MSLTLRVVRSADFDRTRLAEIPLFISPRTVEMHVQGSLLRLGCRTRAEAVRRLAELGALALPGLTAVTNAGRAATLGLMEVPMALPEWTVLVLLSQRPAHGFAVSQLTASDGELGRIWRIPRPVVYRAMSRLVEAGFIMPASVEPGLGPQRTIYTATPKGRQAADQWLSTPVEHVRDIRSYLLVKLALLYRAGDDPADLLARQRAALDPIARAMQAQQAELDGFDAILMAWRRATAAAALGFLDEITPRTEAGAGARPPAPT
jgi:DNA-binding PadR family transcriptional regulator